ncbi:MAG: hypothetical protein LUD16_06940 [Lachnospiraceae bacterium]|nr:hypothetical protein [Lachnospiraceae bacterium]
MVNRIACFFTCGYTEAGAMQLFLKKINPSYDFKQFLPNKTRKRQGDAKIIKPELSGLTGEALLDKVCEMCSNKRYREELLRCKALLIEDDLDGRFSYLTEQEIEQYNQNIVDRICENLGTYAMPIFLVYASPEVESWFIADWENSFKKVYSDKGIVDDVDLNARMFFEHHLKRYVETKILREYVDDVEKFGWFDGNYVKLSDQIISAIQTDVKDAICSLPVANKEYVDQIVASGKLYYSKSKHGDYMLRSIQPGNVEKKCKWYFRKAYGEILDFR